MKTQIAISLLLATLLVQSGDTAASQGNGIAVGNGITDVTAGDGSTTKMDVGNAQNSSATVSTAPDHKHSNGAQSTSAAIASGNSVSGVTAGSQSQIETNVGNVQNNGNAGSTAPAGSSVHNKGPQQSTSNVNQVGPVSAGEGSDVNAFTGSTITNQHNNVTENNQFSQTFYTENRVNNTFNSQTIEQHPIAAVIEQPPSYGSNGGDFNGGYGTDSGNANQPNMNVIQQLVRALVQASGTVDAVTIHFQHKPAKDGDDAKSAASQENDHSTSSNASTASFPTTVAWVACLALVLSLLDLH